MTKKFSGYDTVLRQIHGCQVEWIKKSGNWKIKEISDTDFAFEVDLVILATGFLHVVHEGLIKNLGLQLNEKGDIVANECQTSEPWVFAAGDSASGASLVVSAINSGRQAAAAINQWLQNNKR